MKNNNKEFEAYREQYNEVKMSEADYNKMLERMNHARAEKKEAERAEHRKKSYMRRGVAAAALAAVIALPNMSPSAAYAMGKIPVLGTFFKAVTVREYSYEDDSRFAEINAEGLSADENMSGDAADEGRKSADEINNEIGALVDKWTAEFEAELENEAGQTLNVETDIISTSPEYITLRLSCFSADGSGYEENHYYTVDLETGRRVELADVLAERGMDMNTLCRNIEAQMTEEMKNSDVIYWNGSDGIEGWKVDSVIGDAGFYINEKGQLVVVFDEGETAPMSEGSVEFVI